ncbi:MAG TPA: hypothetical protein PKZ67_03025 [Accumulibacter sp.]|uniref:Uncharacterized protein n=1 Tax=Candidatus Accumulibacter cognatus TaxID=2954383 RepID=A0A080MAJ6_9PROT|nr:MULTISPECIES: hypothetical protein [Candidatus Accumulibacter]MCC2869913.1 hypothetical protein [Candidatus Accumulibacter phosphatis]KFB78006.1 MAG: hypothetical protein AW06_000678 [Candidatus Accumulibacter cognatus]MCM8620660.1 hypothetical protein [Accumulibacter sp.]HMW55905.1 hypothetical protein [Accumulibacter sp.]HNC20176.1 hypothetical protein [Accumulibacter sp.]
MKLKIHIHHPEPLWQRTHWRNTARFWQPEASEATSATIFQASEEDLLYFCYADDGLLLTGEEFHSA